MLALNKIDRVAKPALLPLIDQYRRARAFADIVPISALTGDGTDVLEQVLVRHLPEGEPLYPEDYLTDQPERFFVAETVREKLLHHLRDELPYTTAVLVERFEEPDARGLMRLACVDPRGARRRRRGSSSAGDGDMIKRIGTEARAGSRALLRLPRLPRAARQGARPTGARTSACCASWAS